MERKHPLAYSRILYNSYNHRQKRDIRGDIMGRRRRYRREESLPPAFAIGFIWGIVGVLRSVSLFSASLAPLQGTLQLLGEATLFATATAFITFSLRVTGYITRGNIYKATVYTTQYMLAYVLDSILDGLFSFLGYYMGVMIGLGIAKGIATLYGTG